MYDIIVPLFLGAKGRSHTRHSSFLSAGDSIEGKELNMRLIVA
jgi:hypothetical protein